MQQSQDLTELISKISLSEAWDILQMYIGSYESKTYEKIICKCPLTGHREKTASFYLYWDKNAYKVRYKCFGCGRSGDILDYLKKEVGLSEIEARQKLGIPISKEEQNRIDDLQLIKSFITEKNKYNQIDNICIYPYYLLDGTLHMATARTYYADGTKSKVLPYRIDTSGNKRKVFNHLDGLENIPYNLYQINNAISAAKSENKSIQIIICEGEKDVETFRKFGFKALSFSKVQNKNWHKYKPLLKDQDIIICGDTGQAGDKYINSCKEYFLHNAKSFKILNLPFIDKIGDGDNKDITDWIEEYHKGREDIISCINSSLDLKNDFLLQQDNYGIYKTKIKENPNDPDAPPIKIKDYITTFRIDKAKYYISTNTNDDLEEIELILIDKKGRKHIRRGSITVLNSVTSLKDFLNSKDLTIYLTSKDLDKFKTWINDYFIIEEYQQYDGVQFIPNEDTEKGYQLVTPIGALNPTGKFTVNKVSSENISLSLDDFTPINQSELATLLDNLIKVHDKNIIIPMISHMAYFFYTGQTLDCEEFFNPHYFMPSGSGSGKTTMMNVILKPLLLITNGTKALGGTTEFTLVIDSSRGNYPLLCDEFRPSSWDKDKLAYITQLLLCSTDNNLYERGNYSKKDKIERFKLKRPYVLVGEETYSQNIQATTERSNIVVLPALQQYTNEQKEALSWLIENKHIMHKFGYSLLLKALKVTKEEYRVKRKEINNNINIDIEDRPRMVLTSCLLGMDLINSLCDDLKVDRISDSTQAIVHNIKTNIVHHGSKDLNIIYQYILYYDDLIALEVVSSFTNIDQHLIVHKGQAYIHANNVLSYILSLTRNTNELQKISKGTFQSQAKSLGILTGDQRSITVRGKTFRVFPVDLKVLAEIGAYNMIEHFKKIKANIPDDLILNTDNSEDIHTDK